MKIGVACGGTGGHIFPGLATALELRRRGHEVKLWLAGKAGEQTAIAGWDGAVETIVAEGFSSGLSFQWLNALTRILKAIRHCEKALRRDPPDGLLAMGSYASVGPVWAAGRLGIPVILHEANAVPGRAMSFLARRASAVALGFEQARHCLRHPRLVVTGMPVREAGSAAKRTEFPGLAQDRFTVLITGGSRGAHRLNELASEALSGLPARGQSIQVIHLTGPADEAMVRSRYERAGVPHAVFGFLHDMASAYARAGLAVCRAGASTCAELAAFEVPALLVPYPFAARGHQRANARALADVGAADTIEEKALSVAGLADYLVKRMADSEGRQRMKAALAKCNPGDGARNLADLVETVIRESGRGGSSVQGSGKSKGVFGC